jgi:uncharacterized membrane protein
MKLLFDPLWKIFIKGLTALLPVVLTIYLIYWLGSTAESFLGGWLRAILPEGAYWPGFGLLVGFLSVLLAGVLVDAYLIRSLLRYGESLLARIPVIKSIFGALKDFTRFLPSDGKRRDLQRVVLWRFGGARLIGFVTEELPSERLLGPEAGRLVAVYFPMSYQIGGYTLYLPRDEIEATDLGIEEAMRLVLIGGITARRD